MDLYRWKDFHSRGASYKMLRFHKLSLRRVNADLRQYQTKYVYVQLPIDMLIRRQKWQQIGHRLRDDDSSIAGCFIRKSEQQQISHRLRKYNSSTARRYVLHTQDCLWQGYDLDILLLRINVLPFCLIFKAKLIYGFTSLGIQYKQMETCDVRNSNVASF